jgi:hypothetical protein
MEQELERPRKLEFEPRLLALFLFVTIPFILVGSLLILSSVRSGVNRTIGDHFAELAAANARYLDSYILMKVTNVSRLAISPTLIAEVTNANKRHKGEAESIQAQLLQVDEEWQLTHGLTHLAIDIIDRESSQFLKKVASFNPAYQEILLTDEHGALVAATNLTSDFYQADETWWRNAYGDGWAGAIYVSNVRYDYSAKVHGLDIAVPIRIGEGDDQRVAGVLKTLIDVRDLFSVMASVEFGESGRALLVNGPDRTIINSDDPDEVMKNIHPGFVHLQEALAEERRHFVCQHEDGSTWLAGYARLPEPGPSPEIAWYVIVEQGIEEAQAPVRAAMTYLLWFFGAMTLLVLVFSLYMHFKLVKPVREVGLREEMDRLSGAVSGTNTG